MVSKINFDDNEFEQFENVENTLEPNQNKNKRSTAYDHSDNPQTIVLSQQDWLKKVRTRAITYLSRREYSRVELRKKVLFSLRNYDCENDLALTLLDDVLDDLAQHNWQSDERVAASVSKIKGERYGSARVKHELNQQGLSHELIAHEMAQLASTELQRAHDVWQKKFGQAPADLKEKAKQVRFMASRGFNFDIINRIIKNADNLFED
ncbi:recombination regulator RecX [Hydromonas duriensis]|uniref:Regulatory protein RecX n=1 Tax=Hydromonas duriensis TaxID=1527608 RepID=A0A4R6YBX7_9BURK|nr:recombination regulator RecX [Hydromonas duriensis]TDR33119.1 regulatory protein [Hydromonas duriensis]